MRPLRIAQALAIAAAVAVGTASAATPASVLAKLNAQRRANGIPAGIKENRQWSRACALHNAYQRKNEFFGHAEEQGKPGYTKQGEWAAKHAVLSKGRTWADGNPFELAPIHLMQLLAPQLQTMGVADGNGYVCATTWPGFTRFTAPDAIYTYPGDGTKGWPPSEVAKERPFTPGEAVGLPQGTETGLYVYVFAGGPWGRRLDVKLTAAELRGPAGPVEIKWVDRSTPKIGFYLPSGGILIPVKPLQAATAYQATVTMTASGMSLTKSWRFNTR